MVIKEAFCSECGREMDVYMESFETETEDFCPLCDEMRIFYSRCSGGRKSRWRFADWDGYNPKGCLETEATNITHNVDGKEEPLPHNRYGTVNNYEKVKGPERDDKFEYNYKKKMGKTKIMFDTKTKS